MTELNLWIHRAYYAGLKDAKDQITKDKEAKEIIEGMMESVLQSAKEKESDLPSITSDENNSRCEGR